MSTDLYASIQLALVPKPRHVNIPAPKLFGRRVPYPFSTFCGCTVFTWDDVVAMTDPAPGWEPKVPSEMSREFQRKIHINGRAHDVWAHHQFEYRRSDRAGEADDVTTVTVTQRNWWAWKQCENCAGTGRAPMVRHDDPRDTTLEIDGQRVDPAHWYGLIDALRKNPDRVYLLIADGTTRTNPSRFISDIVGFLRSLFNTLYTKDAQYYKSFRTYRLWRAGRLNGEMLISGAQLGYGLDVELAHVEHRRLAIVAELREIRNQRR